MAEPPHGAVKSEPSDAHPFGQAAQQALKQEPGAEGPVIGGVGSGRRVSTADIQLVQNLIERCLQLYMSQREVIGTLQEQARVDPGFTQLVWQKLEEQNPDFFRAYYTRLKLKDQIVLFNHLLEQQVGMFHKMSQRPWGVPGALPNFGPQAMPAFPGLPPGPDLPHGEPLGDLGSPGGLPTGRTSSQALDALGRVSSGAGLDDVAGLPSGGLPSVPFMDASTPRGQPVRQRVDSGTGLSTMGGAAFPAAPGSSPLRPGFRERSSSTADLTRLPRNFSLSDLALGPFDHGAGAEAPAHRQSLARIASDEKLDEGDESMPQAEAH